MDRRPSIHHNNAPPSWNTGAVKTDLVQTAEPAFRPTGPTIPGSGHLLHPHRVRHIAADGHEDRVPVVARAGVLHQAIHGDIL